jgi:prealbumin domain-containing protein
MRRRWLLAGLSLTAFLTLSAPAGAAEFVVNAPGDPGDGVCTTAPGGCTVREAVTTAAQLGTRDTVRIPAGTFQLTQGALTPNGDIIAGAGARLTTLRADGVAHVFLIQTANNEISGLTLTNGGGQSQAGGALLVASSFAPASATLLNSSVTGNQAIDGGGVANASGTLTIVGSTISGNTATSGGAPTGGGVSAASGTTTIVNSTISGNRAFDEDGTDEIGGGVAGDDATFVLRGATIAGNRATTVAGLYLGGTSTASVTHSIVADGTAVAACGGNVAGLPDDHSISDDASCGFTTANPLLGPLANNGGPTNTQALGFGSPAINSGSTCSAADQRGRLRDGPCDIGAFEFGRPRLTVFKRVLNNQGGTQAPDDFSVHVRAGADVAGSPATGSASGRTYVLAPGSYTVSEDADSRYGRSFSGSCNASGAVTLGEGAVATCTITNNDKAPAVGRLVNATPKSGTVRIKLPNRKRFRRLTEGEQLPVGTIVDTLKGRITLYAAANRSGGIAKADFYDGIFKIGQTKGKRPITTLTLVEKLTGCKTGKGKASAAAKKKKKKRRLWGNGKGRFRTKGKHSAATVVGTKWLVEDRCTSTLTKVARGRVSVRDFVKRKTVVVKKGKRYIARARRT